MHAGGPNEVVPQEHKQRNLQVAVSALRSLSGGIPVNISQTFLQGQVPGVPTNILGAPYTELSMLCAVLLQVLFGMLRAPVSHSRY